MGIGDPRFTGTYASGGRYFTDGVPHVLRPATDVPRTWITPTVAGTATSLLAVDAGSTQVVAGGIIVVGATDLVEAGAAVKNSSPDAPDVILGQSRRIVSNQAISDVYLTALASATGTNCVIYDGSETEANIRAQLTRFEFDSADDVRQVLVSLAPAFSTSRYSYFRIWGIV